MSMTRTSHQGGFGHLAGLAMVVVVFSIVGFIGYKLYANPLRTDTSKNQAGLVGQPASAGLTADDAPSVKSAGDLDKAYKVKVKGGQTIDLGKIVFPAKAFETK